MAERGAPDFYGQPAFLKIGPFVDTSIDFPLSETGDSQEILSLSAPGVLRKVTIYAIAPTGRNAFILDINVDGVTYLYDQVFMPEYSQGYLPTKYSLKTVEYKRYINEGLYMLDEEIPFSTSLVITIRHRVNIEAIYLIKTLHRLNV